MNDPRFGAALRALRRRRGWRQRDVGSTVGVSQQFISKLECGRLGDVSMDELRNVASALDATIAVDLRWHGGGLDRLLDERHATLIGSTAALLTELDWEPDVEATYAHYGERGSIDILAWHRVMRTLLVVEIKTELVSIEATLRKLDEKVRLAPGIAFDRWGSRPAAVARLLVLPSSTTHRRQVVRHAAVLDVALPLRFDEIRAWLRRPVGPVNGLLFVASTTRGSTRHADATGRRVRRPQST
jgi:transcriptional regulator with XRE-family HTH domain